MKITNSIIKRKLQSMQPCSLAYKIVRLHSDGNMFSCNIGSNNPMSLVGIPRSKTVQYAIGYQTFPQPHLPYLFIIQNKQKAKIALKFYSILHPVALLEGWASNIKPVSENIKEYSLLNSYNIYFPTQFPTAICDWFLPTKILGTLKSKKIQIEDKYEI